jgi:hypothetical protein
MNQVITTNLRDAKATLDQVASLETQIVASAGGGRPSLSFFLP